MNTHNRHRSRKPDATTSEHIAAHLKVRIGPEGLDAVAALCMWASRTSPELAERIFSESPILADRLLEHGNPELVCRVYELAGRAAMDDWSTALALLDASPEILRRVDVSVLETLAETAVDVAAQTWTTAVRMIQDSPFLMDPIREMDAASLIPAIYGFSRDLSRHSWTAAVDWLEKSSELIGRLTAHQALEQAAEIVGFCGQIARTDWKIGSLLARKSPEIVLHLGLGGFRILAETALRVERQKPGTGLQLIGESPAIIQQLVDSGRRTSLPGLYEMLCRQDAGIPDVILELLRNSPLLVDRAGMKGMARIGGLAARLARISDEAAAGFIRRSPAILETGNLRTLSRFAGLGARLALTSPEAALALFDVGMDLLSHMTWPDLKKLIGRCLALAGGDSRQASALLFQCSPWVAALYKSDNPEFMEEAWALLTQAARLNPRLALQAMEKAPGMIEKIGSQGFLHVMALTCRISPLGWSAAQAMLAHGPEIRSGIGADGLERFARIAEKMAAQNVYGGAGLLEHGPKTIDRMKVMGEDHRLGDILEQADRLAEHDWRTAISFLDRSPEWIGRLGPEDLEPIVHILFLAVGENPRVAARLPETGLDIFDLLGSRGVQAVADFILKAARGGWEEAVHALERSPGTIRDLLLKTDKSHVLGIFHLAGEIADASPRAALCFLTNSPGYLDAVSHKGLAEIARRIIRLAAQDEEAALAFSRGECTDFDECIRSMPAGLALADAKPVLEHYLRALLGRPIEIREGTAVSVDGKAIYLPARVYEFDDDNDNFIYYKVLATHQEARLEYGSFDFELDEVQDLAQNREKHSTGEEGASKNDLERFYRLFEEPRLIEDLLSIFDDYRIRLKLKEEYPVLGDQMTRVNARRFARRLPLHEIRNMKRLAVEAMARTLLGEEKLRGMPVNVERIVERALESVKILHEPFAGIHDAARAAVSVEQMLKRLGPEAYRPGEPLTPPIDPGEVFEHGDGFRQTSRRIDEQLKRSPSRPDHAKPASVDSGNSSDSSPIAGLSPESAVIRPPDKSGRARPHSLEGKAPGPTHHGADEPEDHPEAFLHDDPGDLRFCAAEQIENLLKDIHREKGIPPRQIEQQVRHLSPNEIDACLKRLQGTLAEKAELAPERGTYLYPEWNVERNGYRPIWTRIREQKPEASDDGFYDETVVKHAGLLKQIRREFQMLRPEAVKLRKRQYDGDEIDLEAAVEYFTERKIGITPSEKNYMRTLRKRRDISVAFLVDISRSTRGETILREKEALILMSEALVQVGDTFAVYAFSGDTRDRVDYYTIKDFEETYGRDVKNRISAIRDKSENRDGAAIRHAAMLLSRRRERTRVMILLSDGRPVDKDYAGSHAVEDTRMALIEANTQGIRTFCITLDKVAADYLPRMYSHSSWVVVDDVANLPEKITGIYRRLTT